MYLGFLKEKLIPPYHLHFICRSSHHRCSIKKCVLRNFTKFTGKNLCQGLFFNKVAGLIKLQTLAQVFSCEFCEISKNTFFREHLWTTATLYRLDRDANGCDVLLNIREDILSL